MRDSDEDERMLKKIRVESIPNVRPHKAANKIKRTPGTSNGSRDMGTQRGPAWGPVDEPAADGGRKHHFNNALSHGQIDRRRLQSSTESSRGGASRMVHRNVGEAASRSDGRSHHSTMVSGGCDTGNGKEAPLMDEREAKRAEKKARRRKEKVICGGGVLRPCVIHSTPPVHLSYFPCPTQTHV